MELIDFLIEAKLVGYASGDQGQKVEFEDNSVGFRYESDTYRYLDKFFGFNPFSGSEFVFDLDGNLVWTMNYFGKIASSCSEPSEVYTFLREAMLKIDRSSPFRGPPKFEKPGYCYKNDQTGSLERFEGKECIFKNDQEIYLLNYHGGAMK